LATPTRKDATTSAAAGKSEDDESFQLESVSTTSTPSGCTGRDWFVYRISQGKNVITGYRRGDLKAVRVEVEQIVVGLNERRHTRKERTGPKRGRPPAQATTPKHDPDTD
jgi:formylmethanofuran dehydrogenase subunit E